MLPKPGLIILDYDDTVVTICDDFEQVAMAAIQERFNGVDFSRYRQDADYTIEAIPRVNRIAFHAYNSLSTSLGEQAESFLHGMVRKPEHYNLKPGINEFIDFTKTTETPLLLASTDSTGRVKKSISHFGFEFERSVFMDDPRHGMSTKSCMVHNYLEHHGMVDIPGSIWVVGNGCRDLEIAQSFTEYISNIRMKEVVMVVMGKNCQLALYDHFSISRTVVVEDFKDLLAQTPGGPN